MKKQLLKTAAVKTFTFATALSMALGTVIPTTVLAAQDDIILVNDDSSEKLPQPVWSFDFNEEDTDPVTDTTGTLTAALSGGTTHSEGHSGNGLHFTGDGGALFNQPDGTTTWTISMWVKGQPGPGSNTVLLSGNEGELKFDQWKKTGKMGISKLKVSDVTFNYAPPKNEWFHVIYASSASGTTLYVNGEQKATTTLAIKRPMRALGCNPDTTGYFVGEIDDLMVFDETLSAEQAAALYEGKATSETTKEDLAPVLEEALALNSGEYTPESWSEVQTAIDTARELMDMEEPESIQLRQAIAALQKAMGNLVLNTEEDHICIVTFNIAANKNPDLKTITNQMRQAGAQICGIQEVDMNTNRTKKDMLAEIASYGTFTYTTFHKTIDFQGGAYGIGTVSSLEITGKQEGDLFSEGISEPRGWQRSLVEKDGHVLALYNTHLTHEKEDVRHKQMAELLEIVGNDPTEYKAITGDFNTGNGLQEWIPFMQDYHLTNGNNGSWYQSFTGPEEQNHYRCIDNIIVTRNIRITDTRVYQNDLSDHWMMTADFEFLAEDETCLDYLKYTMQTADELDESDWGPRSWAALQGALAKGASMTLASTQEEVDAAAQAIDYAREALIPAGEEPAEDTENIKGLLHEAILYAQTITESDSFDKLAPAVQDYITSSLEEAVSVYENAASTFEECAQAWRTLVDAIHYADFYADKNDLAKRVEEAEAIDLSHVTAESAQALRDANASAKEVLEDDNALQERIDAALTALNSAIAGLEESITTDRSLLEFIVSRSDVIAAEADKYIQDDSWTAFLSRLEEARAVLENASATQEEIDAAAEALHNAYLCVRLAPDEDLIRELNSFVSEVRMINRSLFSTRELVIIDEALDQAQALLDAPVFDNLAAKDFVENSIPEIRTLVQDRTDDQKEPEKPAGDDKLQTPSDEKKPAADETRSDAAPVEKSSSVKTAAGLQAGIWMLTAAGAAALGMMKARRHHR